MDEVEFRGYDIEHKIWRYGYYYSYRVTRLCMDANNEVNVNTHHCILYDGFCDENLNIPHRSALVAEASLGQFTGIEDSKERRIFSGDILQKITLPTKRIKEYYLVEFDCNRAAFVAINVQTGRIESLYEIFGEYSEVLVVGNSYENPDMKDLKISKKKK